MCTDFLLQALDGTLVNGRSMEFGRALNTELYACAPNATVVMHGLGKEKITMTTTHGFVGASVLNTDLCTDGLNTAGLSVGALWLPGTSYQRRDHSHKESNVPYGYFANWMLAHCATADDVRRALETGTVCVVNDQLSEPLHFSVHDRRGKSIVIEFVDREAVIYDNPVAVLTNSPDFPWHLQNLRNYVNLSPWNTGELDIGGFRAAMIGNGVGLLGLPGNSTPPSRFVRTALLKQFALPVNTGAEAQALAFHLLNAVDVPLGSARTCTEPSVDTPQDVEYDYTQWVVVKNLTDRVIDVRTYASPLAWRIALDDFDFGTWSGKRIPIPNGPAALPLPLPRSPKPGP